MTDERPDWKQKRLAGEELLDVVVESYPKVRKLLLVLLGGGVVAGIDVVLQVLGVL